ncbi:MAG: hypothetical protein KF878_04415 [Planctomycetes bacterium]|nr:hypothetical protein [Planctomycetota bacterium]
MPWRCGACGVEVADDGCAACPSCAAVKGAWTLFAAQTRRFVVGTKKVVVLRGDDPTPRAADDPARAADAPVSATRAVSLPKPVARDLAARGLLPASRDLLLVRVTARGAAARTVTLVADFAARESEEHALEPHAEADGEGVVDVPIVLVHGEGDLAGIHFPGVHVVDVTEDAGHAVRVEVSALRRPPVRLPLGGHWAAVRLLEPDGRPAAGVAVSLVLADGSRRPATTDDDGNARWEDVPAGAVALELDDPATFPDVVDDDEPAPVDDAPPAPPDDAPAPADDPDADLADYDAHPLQRPWGGARWAAVRLVEPTGGRRPTRPWRSCSTTARAARRAPTPTASRAGTTSPTARRASSSSTRPSCRRRRRSRPRRRRRRPPATGRTRRRSRAPPRRPTSTPRSPRT